MNSPESTPAHVQTTEKKREPGRLRRAVLAGVTATGLALGFGVTTAESASASPTCYGDYCSGQDPAETNCDDDAQTVASIEIKQHWTVLGSDEEVHNLGILETRWSQKCKTNWARLLMREGGDITKIVVHQDSGYEQSKQTQGFNWTTKPGVFYTSMIYSPNHPVYSYAEGKKLSPNSTDWK